ncbi:hypothetical protein ACN38_g2829 [Penicillium nordicum]|uniref:Uncharacterized protein n=1 Tax=Penicillium nordicum TaxID=229535 RepID=A0A0M8PD53_9EURO|nr:hypothetical protein ACN38_g2829 [Penicillium nordicum]
MPPIRVTYYKLVTVRLEGFRVYLPYTPQVSNVNDLCSQPYCCLTGLTADLVLLRYRGTVPGRAPNRSIPEYWSIRECCQVIIK